MKIWKRWENWQNDSAFVEGEITDNELREVTCSADRSGYAIYQSLNKKLL